MVTHALMTKSPIALAKEALTAGQEALQPYSARRSRHDFTQAQLLSILVLRQFFKTDYRGIIELLADWPNLQKVLNLTKIPHFTTLQKAQQRLVKKGLLSVSCKPFFTEHSCVV